MKRLLFLFLIALTLCPMYAQKSVKKEIIAAGDKVKQGKDLDKAEASMMKLLKDSDNRRNEKIWNTLFDALQKQYEQGNEKLYLKQKYDTASLFNIASRMFTVMEQYDSIDAQPDKKGKVKLEHRKDNSNKLNILRPNLYNGGAYYIKKKDYAKAYHLFDQYIDAANQPLFSSYNYAEKDKYLPRAAYWAVYCAYKLKDTRKVLHHTYLALKDTANNAKMLQYLSATYQLEGDSARFEKTLEDGFAHYPLSPYFFPHLVEVYSKRGDWTAVKLLADTALSKDSTNPVFKLTKGSAYLNAGRYDDCFKICDEILKDTTLKAALPLDSALKVRSRERRIPANTYLYAGLAKFNKGVTLDKNVQLSRENRNKILQYYREALPYLEKYRELRPKEIDKWSLPLYTIYLNLNMGKKFDEIDKIMKGKDLE